MPIINEILLQNFIAYCFGVLHLSHSTVKNYLAGIRFTYLRAGVDTCLDLPTSNTTCRINALLRGYKKLNPSSNKKRLPITHDILSKIVSVLRHGLLGEVNDMAMEAMCNLGFFGFMRCGEITCGASFDPAVNMCISDVSFQSNSKCSILLKVSKTDQVRQGVTVNVFSTSSLCCPVNSLARFLEVRRKHGAKPSDPLFVDRDMSPVTRAVFLQWLSTVIARVGLNPASYSGHSLRIGAATSASSAQLEDSLIRTLGRWKSDCFVRYIRTPDSDIQRAHLAMTR